MFLADCLFCGSFTFPTVPVVSGCKRVYVSCQERFTLYVKVSYALAKENNAANPQAPIIYAGEPLNHWL